jgi:hypothetical protein
VYYPPSRDLLLHVGETELLITGSKLGHQCGHIAVPLQAAEAFHGFEDTGGCGDN